MVITVFFGLFGLIPAYLHGRRAERLGLSSSRYWKAFAISFVAAAAVYVAAILAVFALVLNSVDEEVQAAVDAEVGLPSAVDPAPANENPESGTNPTESGNAGSEVNGTSPEATGADAGTQTWSAAGLIPIFEVYADDETESWALFSTDRSTVVVTVPCGGQTANGVSPRALELVSGGSLVRITAEVLPTAGDAAQELARLEALVTGCTNAYDYVSRDGSVLTRCAPLVVDALEPVVRYEESCDVGAGETYAFALFQSGNAVVSASASTVAELDAVLTFLRADLQQG
ncbi:hypothetical protein ACWKWC_01630 [Geodermatophilus nigrescens]